MAHTLLSRFTCNEYKNGDDTYSRIIVTCKVFDFVDYDYLWAISKTSIISLRYATLVEFVSYKVILT